MNKPRIRDERSDIGKPRKVMGSKAFEDTELVQDMPANRRWELRNYEKDKAFRIEQHYKHNLKNKFGLTPEEYQKIFYEQNGVCAICGKPETAIRAGNVLRLAVDHDHKTGKNRSLLCGKCNKLIGFACEDKEVLESAIEYLEFWSEG